MRGSLVVGARRKRGAVQACRLTVRQRARYECWQTRLRVTIALAERRGARQHSAASSMRTSNSARPNIHASRCFDRARLELPRSALAPLPPCLAIARASSISRPSNWRKSARPTAACSSRRGKPEQSRQRRRQSTQQQRTSAPARARARARARASTRADRARSSARAVGARAGGGGERVTRRPRARSPGRAACGSTSWRVLPDRSSCASVGPMYTSITLLLEGSDAKS